jgi:hypothetical protein
MQRGIVEIRAGAPVPPPDSGLFRASQVRRLREWLGAHGGVAREGKLLVAGSSPDATRAFFRLLRGVPGLVPHPRMASGIASDTLAPIARLRLEDDLGLELVHLPTLASYAPLWPLAGYGALGSLLLMEGPVAEAAGRLGPLAEALRSLPRSRLVHVMLLRPGEAGVADEVRRNVELLEESTLCLLPLEGRREPLELLRAAFTRLLP